MHWKLTISEMLSVEISVIQPHIYPPVQWPPSLLSLPKRLRAHFSIVSRLLTFICLPSIPSNLLKLFSSFRPSPRLHAEPSSRAGVELMVLSRLLRHTQAALLRRCSQTDCWRYKARKNKYFLSENTPHHLPVSTFHRRHRELWLPTVAGDVISFNRLPPLGIVSV